MKIVGNTQWSEFEPDAQIAWQRGRVLDARVHLGLIAHPRGVWRMTHAKMNAFDLQRQRLQAVTLNSTPQN